MELCYLAGEIREDYNYILIDCVAEKMDISQLHARLQEYKPNLIVYMPGFETINTDISMMTELAKKLNAKTCIFGYYPTLFYNELMNTYDIDFIIRGEPEYVFYCLCYVLYTKSTDFTKEDGLVYRQEGKIIVNKDRELIKNLDEIKFPKFNHLNLSLYSSGFADKKPFITMLTSRGCPFSCSYCIKTYNDRFRQRSVNNVIKEIKRLQLLYGIKSIRFLDDTFTTNKKWVMDFCQKIKEKNITLQYSVLSRPETLDDEMIQALSETGCNRLFIGVESGSEAVLKQYNRNYVINANIFNKCRFYGIETFAFFMLGAPYETEEDINKSIQVAKELDPDFITVNVMRIYPGTLDFTRSEAKFSLNPHKIEYDNEPNQEELNRLMFKFYRAFYLRPKWIIRKIPYFIVRPKLAIKLLGEYLKWEKKKKNM
jgi:magnesium-protoporphyrin IX monomethyl ester (oxidative) cyclase